ncbi:thrombomodulin [Melanotaenia boesemani]|uniref:thrombomodulin n=1 Tax=Melanotaenia boesemani TaxID=1250792 RepID=UPI001C059F97|nr:thrombomodulin [Melanotaenia boesemani]
MTMAIFESVMFLLIISSGFGLKQTSTCRPVCVGDDCITVNLDKVDFKTAEEACRDSKGELLTFQFETDKPIFDILSQDLFGNFWIGLRLPAGSCSNLSQPLRGYESTSGNTDWMFSPSFNTWTHSAKLCSPHCISLSNNQKWTERLCTDKTDGFLCKAKHKDACLAQELSDSVFFKSTETCKSAPCEHVCTDMKEGYTCSCFKGYMPDSKDPKRCKLHCAAKKCPLKCEGNTASQCSCPDGFIRNENFCEDIDECEMGECAHLCENNFGSFVCSCPEGFVLKDQVKCIKAEETEGLLITTPDAQFVKPAAKNNTLKSSSVPAGAFLWIWVVLAVVVIVSVLVIRALVQHRRRRENVTQQSIAPAEKI